MCRHAPTRHTHTLPHRAGARTHTPAIHAPASPARCHTAHTHAHPRLHAPASHARLPHRTRARIPPPFTRQQAAHACHTAHAHCHTPACTRQRATHACRFQCGEGIIRGAGWDARPSPAETVEIGLPPSPACAAMHQRNTRTLPHPRHPRASKPRTPAASNAALGVARGARVGRTASPAETVEIGPPPFPACAAMHQRDTRSRIPPPSTRQRAARAYRF